MSGYDLSRPVLERLRDAADIVTVISEHITLKKQGRNWMGLCPFHGEKTPSFAVSRDKGTYYCFGCKRGGDVIDFVMELDRVTFPEAVERLAQRFGVELPAASPQARERRQHDELLAEALEAAQAAFVRRIADDIPRGFLERRGVSQHAALEFGLGYAPDDWRVLYDQLRTTIPERVLLDAGLLVKNEQGRVWDRFRNRVTIPIRNARGQLVGFGGRALGDERPKYLNSPETSLFAKSHLLFAMDRAAAAIGERGRALVVEGYFDCLALHVAGLTETVATLGTSLSEHHAKDLARKAERIVVCYDGDSAGRQAAVTAVRTLLAADVDVRVLLLPEGSDPDDLVRSEGAEAFGQRIERALSVAEFLVLQMGDTRDARRRNASLAAELIDACPDPARRFLLKEQLALATGLPIEVLGSTRSESSAPRRITVDELPAPGELAVLRYLLIDAPPERRRSLVDALPLEPFFAPASREILAALKRLAADGGTLEISVLTSDIEDRELRRVVAALEFEVPPVADAHFDVLTRELWERQRQRRLAELTRAIVSAEQEGDRERVARLLIEKSRLLRDNAPPIGPSGPAKERDGRHDS